MVYPLYLTQSEATLLIGFKEDGAKSRSIDYLVPINTKLAILKRPKFYKILGFIVILIIILLLVGIVILGLLYSQSLRGPKLCTTDECLRSAANLKYSLDSSVDPCDNFYEYACGRWSDEHPNHGWYPTFSTFEVIGERIAIATLKFLQSKPKEEELLPINQTRSLYESCIDEDARDKLGFGPLFRYLEEVGLPKLPHFFTLSDDERLDFEFGWSKVEANIRKTFAMDVFFGFLVDLNVQDHDTNVMYMGTLSSSSPLPSPVRKMKGTKEKSEDTMYSAREEKSRNIMKYIIKRIAQNVTTVIPKEELLDHAIDVIMNMTETIDGLSRNYTDPDDLCPVSYTFEEFQKKIDDFTLNNINKNNSKFLKTFIGNIFKDTNVSIDFDQDKIYISAIEEEYIYQMAAYLMDSSDIYIELYMWWNVVYAMIISTTSDISHYVYRQTEPYYSSQIARSKALDCAELVSEFMGMAVSYGIYNANYTKERSEVLNMLYDIRNAFIHRLMEIDWMDRKTKEATLEKTRNMITFIGFPDWFYDEGALEEYYAGIEITSYTLLDNLMSIIKVSSRQTLESLRQKNERELKGDPITVNAFNAFYDNSINVPMAILTFPVYNLGLESLNYGALGTILGHELTHGFDNQGRMHDKSGNLKQWWTNTTVETFEKKAACFIRQYDNYTLEGVNGHINGEQTLDENIADNGGLHHAFSAYQNYITKTGLEPKLPGFENFTHNQLFFIAYASVWCETRSVTSLESQLLYDAHSPASIRILGTLQNSNEFAKTFNCPSGSNMNPKKERCRIW